MARIAVLDDDPTGSQTVHGVAAEFAARTGVDALAVAVGNVHGYTPVPVRLDLGRLRAIDAVCPCALVLHGASGLPEEDLLGAIAAGVVKVKSTRSCGAPTSRPRRRPRRGRRRRPSAPAARDRSHDRSRRGQDRAVGVTNR